MTTYYRTEDERHPSLRATGVSFEDACEAIRRLAAEFETEIRDVTRTSGNRHSYYRHSAKTICLNTDHVNWLTVIHEFAHAMDGAERDREKAVWAKAEDVFCAGMRAQYPLRDGGLGKFHFGSETPGVTGTMTPEYKAWLRKHPRPATRKWHASTHAEFVDILAQRVVERGWIASIPAERAARDLARNEKRQQIAAMVSDPAVIRAKKIERRKEQIERLEMRLRRLDATKKAITTRVRSARRSLAALERAASKKEAT